MDSFSVAMGVMRFFGGRLRKHFGNAKALARWRRTDILP